MDFRYKFSCVTILQLGLVVDVVFRVCSVYFLDEFQHFIVVAHCLVIGQRNQLLARVRYRVFIAQTTA